MSVKTVFLVCIGLGIALGGEAAAQESGGAAPAEPRTIWDSLGFSKLKKKKQERRDARVNADGCSPGEETKPKLLKLSDKQNLESENELIKIAAEAKRDQDLAPQKIKALRYLSSLGCGCNADVEKAILSGMEDCVPAVRAEAVRLVVASMHGTDLCSQCQQRRGTQKHGIVKKIAACQICKGRGCRGGCRGGGNPMPSCSNCQTACAACCGTCCTEEIHRKLEKMANGQDASGCFIEGNPQIRALAAEALSLCDPNPVGIDDPDPELPTPVPQPQPEKKRGGGGAVGIPQPGATGVATTSSPSGSPPAGTVYVNMADSGPSPNPFIRATLRECNGTAMVVQFDRAYLIPKGSHVFIKTQSGGDWRGKVVETAAGFVQVQLEVNIGGSQLNFGEQLEVAILAAR